MVYTHDMAGKLTSINKAAERITGYTRTEALQMKFSQLVAPEFQPVARKMIDRQIAAESPVTQVAVRCPACRARRNKPSPSSALL